MAQAQPAVFSPQSPSSCEFSKVFLIKLAPQPDQTTFRWAEPCFPRGKALTLELNYGVWLNRLTWIILESYQKKFTLETLMQFDVLQALTTFLVRTMNNYNLIPLFYSLKIFIYDQFQTHSLKIVLPFFLAFIKTSLPVSLLLPRWQTTCVSPSLTPPLPISKCYGFRGCGLEVSFSIPFPHINSSNPVCLKNLYDDYFKLIFLAFHSSSTACLTSPFICLTDAL